MSHLATAQTRALTELLGTQESSSRPDGVHTSQKANNTTNPPSSTSQLHVTGLDLATHQAVFNAHAPSTHLATQQATDYSALMLDQWLDEYMRERNEFSSVSLFAEIKLKELVELTSTLHVGAAATSTPEGQQKSGEKTQQADQQQHSKISRSVPSKLRTAVCIDLLDLLIASILNEHTTNGQHNHHSPHASLLSDTNQQTTSRHALGQLLLRLRDELIKSIYVQPLPSHLYLQNSAYFMNATSGSSQTKSKQQRPHSLSPQPPSSKRITIGGGMPPLPGASTHRAYGSKQKHAAAAEEKSMENTGHTHPSGSSTHRARLTHLTASRSNLHSSSSSTTSISAPPSTISSLLLHTEWFTLIPKYVSRNHHLSEQARIIMIPSKLFRLRQIQKKVVANMTQKWRMLLMRWKFWEWREITKQKKLDRKEARGSKISTYLTNRLVILEQRLHFYQWRQVVIYKKYQSVRSAKSKGLINNAELIEETSTLSHDTQRVRDEIVKIETHNQALSTELKSLRTQLETSQINLQDTSKHLSSCKDLLLSLKVPMKIIFHALNMQLDSFTKTEFTSVHALVKDVCVNNEYQQQLEGLLIMTQPTGPSLTITSYQHGLETSMNMNIGGPAGSLISCLTQGTQKQRTAICAEIVARWLALQLKMCSGGGGSGGMNQMLNVGGGGSSTSAVYSEYLQKQDNQQRLAAALARVRQLCSNNAPAILPSFPAPNNALTHHGNQHQQMMQSQKGKKDGKGAMINGAATPSGVARGKLKQTPSNATLQQQQQQQNQHESSSASLKVATGSDDASAASVDPQTSPSKRKTDSQQNNNNTTGGAHSTPNGTLSTPIRVFQHLRDTDRSETIFSTAATLLHADTDIARSMKLTPDKRWMNDERNKVAELRTLIDTLRIHPDMKVQEMDTAVQTVHEGIYASYTAIARARQGQARVQQLEDEVFAQSVKLLHQQAQRRQKHGGGGGGPNGNSNEKDNTTQISQDILDLDLSLFLDLFEKDSISKIELHETNSILSEYSRDLYKIFVYYCSTHISSSNVTSSSTAAYLLSSATSSNPEPRMGHTEYWKFVRDCKMKLEKMNHLIDLVFFRVADRASFEVATSATTTPVPATPATGATSSSSDAAAAATSPTATTTTAASPSLDSTTTALTQLETESLIERLRQADSSASKDIGFKQFSEILLRLACLKFNERYLPRKIKSFLLSHVLPNTSQKALAYHKSQLLTQQINSSTMGLGSQHQIHINLQTPEVETVFRKYATLLKQVFQIYSRLTKNDMTMTFNDFLGFAREFELLHKYVTQHDLKQLFSNVLKDGVVNQSTSGGVLEDVQNLVENTGSGGTREKRAERAERERNNATSDDVSTISDDPTSDSTASAANSKELSYRQFLELLAAVSHYVIRNPYFALHDRVEKFILTVLASRKKLPTKVYRSAV